MINIISTEFLKLRKSKMLLLAIIASLLPGMVKYLQYTLGNNQDAHSWEWFLASGQEFMIFSMLTVVVLVSNFIFTMEYQYNTASYIFTSSTSKAKIFVTKIISLLALIAFIFVVSGFSELLLGYLAIKSGLAWDLLLNFTKVIAWYIFSYFLISIIVVMLSVLIKKFVVSAVVVLGYIILFFPFHLKNNIYICPFMTPAVVASKLYGSSNYIFINYYKDVWVNSIGIAIFLLMLAIVSLIIAMNCYKKQDIIK